ncbi:MerR family transcriptional regulator [Micromonospora sp. WMMD980]|uniref:MerR family transcriptional regulator n=1 Tax=Micromonospora sp. WMMD980 TaxID=3016088 RepID=UPI0024171094|nr:MerR family transcriptional regulator [Micromonospora sp. WMMD980]MDG4801140.1 MerR family transcriptional regulator [Micromonospora sp. WMMD980]
MTDTSWAPQACTLPTAERPLRPAEFDRLFHDAVHATDRVSARHLRLRLAAAAVTGLRSGQLADAAGVNVQTLRYYERRGLLDPPRRSPGGHRLYPAETVTLLRVVKTAQRLGFTLAEVADLLDAGRHRHGRGRDTGLQAPARQKLAEVERRLADLTVIRDTLRAAISAGCDDLIACAGTSCCPLPFAGLAALDDRAEPGDRPAASDDPAARS